MRKILLAAALAAVVPFAFADEPKKADDPPAKPKIPVKLAPKAQVQPKEKKEPTLKVGDAAPKFSADTWLQGTAVNAFQPDKVYVVEFWATWCGPCIVMMPHLGELQRDYRDKGVTFIGYSAKDPNNSAEKVAEFVKKRGEKLGYTFAYGDNRDVYGQWMTAAGQNGIPCCFVVDKAGKLAYIGHPMYLDYVLPKVVAGQWGEADQKAVEDVKKEVSAVFTATRDADPEVTLKAINELNAKYPWAANIPYFVGPRISKLIAAKKFDEACTVAEAIVAKAAKNDDTSMLGSMAMQLRMPAAKGEKKLLELSLKAALANLKAAGETEPLPCLSVAESHLALGDKAAAKTFVTKALDGAKTPVLLSSVMRSALIKEDKDLAGGAALKLAETQLKAAPESDTTALMNVADLHFALGDKAKAKEFGQKAVDAAKVPAMKAMLERRVKAYGDD